VLVLEPGVDYLRAPVAKAIDRRRDLHQLVAVRRVLGLDLLAARRAQVLLSEVHLQVLVRDRVRLADRRDLPALQ
jgi:hypothetical protein